MKRSYLTVLSLLVALLFLGTTAAIATESVVFVDDDPTNSDSQTFYVGTWTESTFFPQTYGQGYHFSRSAGSLTMRASLDLDETGGGRDGTSGSVWQAFARWSAGGNRCNAVRIEVRNATTNSLVTSEVVNQTTQGLQFNWTPIGSRFTAVPNHLYEIRFISPGTCVTTADGGMFVQQTYDSSDVYNLTALSTIDEAGLEYDNSPTSTPIADLTTCGSRTILKQVTVSVPDSISSSYVVCLATGRTAHAQTGKWVFYAIDDAAGNTADIFTYTGVATSTATYNNIDSYAMQKVYSYSSEGGSFTYYLKACRQDTATTGTAFHDDFVCVYFPTRY